MLIIGPRADNGMIISVIILHLDHNYSSVV